MPEILRTKCRDGSLADIEALSLDVRFTPQSGSRALHIVVMHKDIVVIAQGAVVAAPPVEPNAPWRVTALRTHRHGYNNLSQRGSHQAH